LITITINRCDQWFGRRGKPSPPSAADDHVAPINNGASSINPKVRAGYPLAFLSSALPVGGGVEGKRAGMTTTSQNDPFTALGRLPSNVTLG